jgi:nucleoside-diphosphate-sugar epimerase
MKKIIVTGGSGFIGSELIKHLVKKYIENIIDNF